MIPGEPGKHKSTPGIRYPCVNDLQLPLDSQLVAYCVFCILRLLQLLNPLTFGVI